jgi:hypothetical protein
MRGAWKTAFATALILACGCFEALGQTCEAPSSSADSRPPTKLALLIGISEYQSQSVTPLRGPRNDVEAMREVLTKRFQFPAENIVVLLDRDATRAAVLDAFCRHLVGRARHGDAVVFYFSGHGSRMGDTVEPGAGDEADGYDETLVAHDSRVGDIQDIRDDEINKLLQLLPTDNVTVILDSCHSGTGAKLLATPRRAPDDPRFPPPARAGRAAEPSNGFRSGAPRYALITGARANQLSFEDAFEGPVFGALTYFLVRAMNSASVSATYRDVVQNVAAQVNARFRTQEPQLEGANSDNILFGEETVIPVPYLEARPDGSQVLLKGGTLHRVTRGSEYSIYPPGTQDFTATGAVARVEVIEVRPFESVARIVDGEVRDVASRAIETVRNFAGSRLRVRVESEVRPAVAEAVAGALQRGGNHNVELVGPDESADLALSTEPLPTSLRGPPGESLALRFPDGSDASPALPFADPRTPERLAAQLRQWSRWFDVASITTPNSRIQAIIELSRAGAPPDNSEPKDSVFTIEHGSNLTLTVRNAMDRDFYVNVLGLFPDGSIELVTADPGGVQVARGRAWSESYPVSVRRGQTERDILLIFISTEPVNVLPLTQPGARVIGRPMGDWRVETRAIVVHRRRS